MSAMEDQTQAVLGDEEEEGGDQGGDISPVGYLRVLSQKDLEQTDYPVQQGKGIDSIYGKGDTVCVCVCVCVSE